MALKKIIMCDVKNTRQYFYYHHYCENFELQNIDYSIKIKILN